MLHEILKTRLGQSRVYEMSFDVKGNVTDQKGAAVSNISHADGQLSFQLSETALPFPIDQKKDVGFKYVPFAQEFNRQSLKIDGLDDGEYTLKIDDQDVGTYTAKKLSEGIDLSDNINTPQYIKALELREKILGRKIILEQWMRIIRSNLKKSLSWQDKEGGKNIDWDDTKSILASVQRVIAAGQSKKGGFTGWRAYVMTSAEHALENYPALVEELAQMRMDLSKVNVAETRQYSLTKK